MKRTTKPKKVIKNITKIPNKEEVKQYTREELEAILPIKQRRFCHAYILEYNGTRSYMEAYGKSDTKKNQKVASVAARQLIVNPRIQQYIAHIQRNIEREVGITKVSRLKKLKTIADADLSDLFKDWLTRKELKAIRKQYPGLTSVIKKTESKVVHKTDPMTGEPFYEEYLKVELKDSLRAEEMIFKAMGYYEAEKIEMKSETKVEIDITKYTDEEKAALLALSRKSQYIE